jgi:hypothetical protein
MIDNELVTLDEKTIIVNNNVCIYLMIVFTIEFETLFDIFDFILNNSYNQHS